MPTNFFIAMVEYALPLAGVSLVSLVSVHTLTGVVADELDSLSEAIVRAVETLDLESHRVFRVALENDWRILLTADHGNCDEMINPNTGEPHTQHTEYPVPFLIMGEGPVRLSTGRGLADIAPTILELLGLPQPQEMTGRSLILKQRLR